MLEFQEFFLSLKSFGGDLYTEARPIFYLLDSQPNISDPIWLRDKAG